MPEFGPAAAELVEAPEPRSTLELEQPPGGIRSAHSIVCTPERIFVSDEFSRRVVICNAKGNLLHVVGSNGSGEADLRSPRGLAVLDDQLWVCDSLSNRIVIFDMSGRQEGSIRSAGEEPLREPVDVKALDADHVVVLDRRNSRALVFDAQRRLHAVWRSHSSSGLTAEGAGAGVLPAIPADEAPGLRQGFAWYLPTQLFIEGDLAWCADGQAVRAYGKYSELVVDLPLDGVACYRGLAAGEYRVFCIDENTRSIAAIGLSGPASRYKVPGRLVGLTGAARGELAALADGKLMFWPVEAFAAEKQNSDQACTLNAARRLVAGQRHSEALDIVAERMQKGRGDEQTQLMARRLSFFKDEFQAPEISFAGFCRSRMPEAVGHASEALRALLASEAIYHPSLGTTALLSAAWPGPGALIDTKLMSARAGKTAQELFTAFDQFALARNLAYRWASAPGAEAEPSEAVIDATLAGRISETVAPALLEAAAGHREHRSRVQRLIEESGAEQPPEGGRLICEETCKAVLGLHGINFFADIIEDLIARGFADAAAPMPQAWWLRAAAGATRLGYLLRYVAPAPESPPPKPVSWHGAAIQLSEARREAVALKAIGLAHALLKLEDNPRPDWSQVVNHAQLVWGLEAEVQAAVDEEHILLPALWPCTLGRLSVAARELGFEEELRDRLAEPVDLLYEDAKPRWFVALNSLREGITRCQVGERKPEDLADEAVKLCDASVKDLYNLALSIQSLLGIASAIRFASGAVDLLEAATDEDPGVPRLMSLLCALARLREYKELEEQWLAKAAETGEPLAGTHAAAGNTLFRAGDAASAMSYLEQSLTAREPSIALAYCNCLLAAGRRADAEALRRKLAAGLDLSDRELVGLTEPSDWSDRLRHRSALTHQFAGSGCAKGAQRLEATGKIAEAGWDAEAAGLLLGWHKAQPARQDLLPTLSSALNRLGQAETAIERIEGSFEHAEPTFKALNSLRRLYWARGDHRKTQQVLAKLKQYDSGADMELLHQAIEASAAGETRLADRLFESIEPGTPAAAEKHSFLIRRAFRSFNLNGCRNQIADYMFEFGCPPQALLFLTLLRLKLHRFGRAIDCICRLRALTRNTPALDALAGICLLSQGKHEPGRALARRSIASGTDSIFMPPAVLSYAQSLISDGPTENDASFAGGIEFSQLPAGYRDALSALIEVPKDALASLADRGEGGTPADAVAQIISANLALDAGEPELAESCLAGHAGAFGLEQGIILAARASLALGRPEAALNTLGPLRLYRPHVTPIRELFAQARAKM